MTQMSRALLGVLVFGASSFLPSASALADAAAAPSAKIAVPDSAAQRDARKRINETFAKDIAKAKKPAEKAAVAKQLLQAGMESKSDPAGAYEMLSMARDLAVAGGDADTALAAITGLDSYAIDALKLKTDALATILKSTADAQDALTISAKAAPLVDEALEADRYSIARQLSELTVTTARAAKDANALAQANARIEEVREIEAASGPAAKAAGVLAAKPNDPAASLTLGRFEAFLKKHWEKGLPLLRGGSDATLKALAEAELLAANDTDKQVQLADGWWSVAEKERGAAQAHVRQHAANCYKIALPGLTGLAKARAEKRLKESPAKPLVYTGWVDLLKLVKTERDAVIGKWTLEKGVLTVSGSDPAELKIAAKLANAYALRIEYQRSAGGEMFAVYLPVADSQVMLELKPQEIALQMVDGKPAAENETFKAGTFDGDKKKHILDIAVWQGEPDARIIVLFDGKQQIDWSGAASRLKVHYNWVLPPPMSLGLASYRTAFVISGFGMRDNAEAPPPLPSKK